MRRERLEIGGEAGQASVEWVGLLLALALGLGALGAFAGARGARAPTSDRGSIGKLIAGRIACAARGSCAVGTGASAPAPASSPPPARVPWRGGGPSRRRAIDALRRLRGAGLKIVRRAWIACLGYRRLRYELDHPLAPNEMMPLDDALDIANGCLNPYAFLVEDG